jgi:Kef-type K+ transport system membrane component KefB
MSLATLAAGGGPERIIALDAFVILAVASAVAMVMQRVRLAIVPAYLIAGAIIGPEALGLAGSRESLADVSRLAIVLLLFGIGMELDVAIMRRGLGRMVLAGVASCALSIAAGIPVARLFGLPGPAAVAVCMALSMSSTAVVLRIIAGRRELRRRSGRLAFAILVVQDILVLVMLAVLPAMAPSDARGAEPAWTAYAAKTGLMVGSAVALMIVARAALPLLLRESLRGGRLEVMMMVGLAAALAAALAAQRIGFSLEMGAFLAGFVLSGTPFRHQLTGQVGPLRDIFSALFFTTVGMRLDPSVLAEGWWVILLALLAMVAVKSLVIGGVCWAVGALSADALIVGLSLAQGGEFSLVLLQTSVEAGIVSPAASHTAIALVVVSLVLTPALVEAGRAAGRAAGGLGHAPWVRTAFLGEDAEEMVAPGPRHVIVGGFGPVGRRIAEVLEQAGVSHTVVELNPDTVVEQLRRRRSIVFGDVANLHVLETAGLGHADALILTIPDEGAALRACALARRRRPRMFIAARTGLLAGQGAAIETGADHVVVEEMATAEALARVVMDRLGLAAAPRPAAPAAQEAA